MSIKRYQPESNMYGCPLIDDDEDGLYVRYDDHVAEIARLMERCMDIEINAPYKLLDDGGVAATLIHGADVWPIVIHDTGIFALPAEVPECRDLIFEVS